MPPSPIGAASAAAVGRRSRSRVIAAEAGGSQFAPPPSRSAQPPSRLAQPSSTAFSVCAVSIRQPRKLNI